MSFSYETPKADPNAAPQSESYETPKPRGYEIPNYNQNATQNTQAYRVPNNVAAPIQKSNVVAGLLAIFLGGLGIHKFYLGYAQAGVIMLLVTLLGAIIFIGPVITCVVALIEGILYLTKNEQDFYQIYVVGDRPWF